MSSSTWVPRPSQGFRAREKLFNFFNDDEKKFLNSYEEKILIILIMWKRILRFIVWGLDLRWSVWDFKWKYFKIKFEVKKIYDAWEISKKLLSTNLKFLDNFYNFWITSLPPGFF